METIDQELFEYIKSHSPLDWHQVAWNWNWDGPIEIIDWIASQKECDQGTALLLYWRGGPGWTHQYSTREEVPQYELGQYDLNMKIENNLVNGFYVNENVFYDPKNDMGTDWTKEYSDKPRKQSLPESLTEATKGEKIEKQKFIEGYPPEICEKYGIK